MENSCDLKNVLLIQVNTYTHELIMLQTRQSQRNVEQQKTYRGFHLDMSKFLWPPFTGTRIKDSLLLRFNFQHCPLCGISP